MWALILNDAWIEGNRIFEMLGPIWYTSASILNLSNRQRKFIGAQTRGSQGVQLDFESKNGGKINQTVKVPKKFKF